MKHVRSIPVASALLALCAAATAQIDDGSRLFTVPDTRDARALAEASLDHAQAQRWSEALHALQRVLEEHRGDVLSPEWHEGTSLYPAFLGAAAWATVRLFELPPSARELYRRRHEAQSTQAYERARATGDRRALVEVATRWPISAAAERAWWTLGDLELELGQVREAARAWNRAAQVRALSNDPLAEGAAARLAFAEDVEKRYPALAGGNDEAELRIAGPGEGSGPVPDDEGEQWSCPLPKGPFEGAGGRSGYHNVFGVLAGDRLLASTSLQLVAIDVHSGEPAWISDKPPGWERVDRNELYDAIDHESVLIAPAASGGVALAALQIAYAKLPSSDYQGIPITKAIPERRLYAFELETGEPLWNHHPPPGWDGDSGTFAQRMLVAGPPAIAGSRVIVPSYLLQGRIDYHVGCYDLATGELLWSTAIVSGQRELNMFGRHVKEFCAPPVRVEGERVIALTQLGTVAALDVVTGRILWETAYEQIRLPRTKGWEANTREQVWRNAPPVVADGVVIAAPVDSKDVVAFDLEHGGVVWAYPLHRELRSSSKPDVLIGADRDTLYFGGETVVALRKPGGLSARGPFDVRWDPFGLDSGKMHQRARALLGASEILVPTPSALSVLDKATGRELPFRALEWSAREEGNLVLSDGALFSVTGAAVHGYFDWKVLLERADARHRADPEDRLARLAYAQLLLRRADNYDSDGQTSAAMADVRRVDELLRPLLEDPANAADRQLGDTMHRALRTGARLLARLRDPRAALARLDEARGYAYDLEHIRDTLLEQERLVRDADDARWLRVLADLERVASSQPMPPQHLRLSPDPLLGEGDSALGVPEQDVPVGLWVLVERSWHHGDRGEFEAELADLHAILARYGDRPLVRGVSAYELASARIARRLDHGQRDAYTRFEREAQALYDRAQAGHDGAALMSVTRLYPHSAAARRARESRLQWAFEQNEIDVVAALVREALSERPTPTQDDAELLLRLGQGLAQRGNHAYLRGLVAALARDWPNLVSPVAEHEGKTLRELAAALAGGPAPEPPSERTRFDASLGRRYDSGGAFMLLGEVPRARPDGTPLDPFVLVARRDKLEAWPSSAASGGPARPAWTYELSFNVRVEHWNGAVLVEGGRVLVAAVDRVVGLDAETGELAWEWSDDDQHVGSISSSDGVCLAEIAAGDGTRVQALDAHAGTRLWNVTVPKAGGGRPTCGDGKAVFLWSPFGGSLRATTVDLFLGRVTGSTEFDDEVGSKAEDHAWIEDGLLVLPSFLAGSSPSSNRIVAYDLERQRRAWVVELDDKEELHSIARVAGETYLYLRPGRSEADTGGSLVELKVATGATRLVWSLRPGEEPMGLPRSARCELSGPYVFLLGRFPGSTTTPITAVRLPYGKHWVHPLPVSYEEFFQTLVPLPVLSDSTVALAYSTVDRRDAFERDTHLLLLDRASGRQRDKRILSPELGLSDQLSLLGAADSLFLVGRGRSSREDGQLEIWRRDP